MNDEAPSASPTAEDAAVGATATTTEVTATPETDGPSPATAGEASTTGDKPASEDAKTPESSTGKAGAKEAPKREKLLNVMKDVAKKINAEKAKSPVAEQKGKLAADATVKTDAEKSADAAKVDDKDLPFHNHPRFQQLTRERAQFKEGYDQHNAVLSFMEKNSLVSDEVKEGFQVMALIKNNPAQAREALKTWVARLDEYLGDKLPKDLQEKVEAGSIDAETAKEVAITRRDKDGATRTAEAAKSHANTLAMQSHGKACADGVNVAESAIKARDPDYAVKQPFVTNILTAKIAREGLPKTPEIAVAWFNDALKTVNLQFAPLGRNRVATKPTPSTAGKVTETAKPKNMLEALKVASDKYQRGKRAA